MNDTDLDLTLIEELSSSFEIPCDYAEWRMSATSHSTPASWIARARCVACPNTAQRLICTDCKDLILRTESGVSCSVCGDVIAPARHAYVGFEAL